MLESVWIVAQKEKGINIKAQNYCVIVSVQEKIDPEPVDNGAEEDEEMPEEMRPLPL